MTCLGLLRVVKPGMRPLNFWMNSKASTLNRRLGCCTVALANGSPFACQDIPDRIALNPIMGNLGTK